LYNTYFSQSIAAPELTIWGFNFDTSKSCFV